MKFQEIQNIQEPKKHYSLKEIKKISVPDDIKSIFRYGDLSIILMYPNTKGSLLELSTLVNDGNKPCSWVCRISFYKNEWNISIAPHEMIHKNNIKLNVFEKIKSTFPSVQISGNIHIASIKTPKKEEAENIINFIISVFYNQEINGIKNIKINKKFIISNSSGPYVLEHSYKTSSKTNIKNMELINSILKYNVDTKDKTELEEMINLIKENKKIDLDKLNILSLKYCSEKERLKIAIKFMS